MYVTPTSVGILTALLERTREVPRRSVARLVQVSTGYMSPYVFYVLFVGLNGRCLMRASSMYYDPKDLATLAGAIGVRYEARELIRPDELCREIPGSAPWIVRHPWIPALLMVPVAIVVFIVWFVVYGVVTGQSPQ